MRLLEFFRPFRAIVTRRVTEEEQVSVEGFYATETAAKEGLDLFLGVMRDHRKKTNDEVVRLTQQQLAGLDTSIENRGETLRELDKEIEARRLKLKSLDARAVPRSA